MMLRIRFVLPLVLALATSAAFAQNYTTVEERMTGAEFKAAGLDKLTPEELAALNTWLQQQGSRAVVASGATPASSIEDRMGFENSIVRRELRSRIQGEFDGWKSGKGYFVLENGQIWRQVDASQLVGIKAVVNPAVIIRPGMLGSWNLQVEGYNTRAKVERVK